jgi:hypothetical protein
MITDDKKIFEAFCMEAEFLKRQPKLNALNLQKAANHLAIVLKMPSPTVVLAKNIDTGDYQRALGTFNPMKETLGKDTTVKIRYNLKKNKMIEVFTHELYHRVQFLVPKLMQRALSRGTLEKDCRVFVKKVMKKVDIEIERMI